MGKPIKFSDQDAPWFARSRKADARKYRTRELRQRILIVCEGEKTEPSYFQAIKVRLPRDVVELCILGEGANTLSLVHKAQEHRAKGTRGGFPYDQVWVVFDRDGFPADDFDNAIRMATSDHIQCAWSNEAFELWYLLHFEDRQTGMSRSEYQATLSRYLGSPYQKNAKDMFVRLEYLGDRQAATRRAEALRAFHHDLTTPPHRANPCTQVDLLVVELLRFQTS